MIGGILIGLGLVIVVCVAVIVRWFRNGGGFVR